MPVSPLVAVSALAAVVAGIVAAVAANHREKPGAPSFVVLMMGAFVWAATYAVALLTFDPGTRQLLELPIEVGKALIAPAWLLFSLGYAGYGKYVTRRSVAAVMVVPVVTVVLTATNPTHGLMWTDYRVAEVLGAATAAYDPGPWFYLHAVYGYLLVGGGLLLVIEHLLSRAVVYREQALALAVGAALPTGAHLVRTFRLGPLPTVDFTPPALAVTGVAFGYAFLRLDLFGFSPATRRLGRRAALDDVSVGVAVVDDDGRIVDLNAAAERTFDCATAAVRRRPLADLLAERRVDGTDDGATETARADGSAPDMGVVDGPIVLDTSDGRRTFEVAASDVAGYDGGTVGRTVTFQDVTERERRQQRLEVLNRVLRHNLRNELTVIAGHARSLADALDGDESRRAAVAAERADALAAIGEKARDVERMVAASADPPERFDAVAVMREAVRTASAEAADDDRVEVTVDAPAELPVESRRAVLRPTVAALVENAVEYGDARVEVSIDAEGDALVVTVADDGPGIPEAELAALVAGEETSLSHGSGLGLWLAKWGTDALGGDLAFEERDPGTAVTVRVPGIRL